jgi:tetratricopeptide (TPR) repeat protein
LGDAWQGKAVFDQAIQAYQKALEFNSECSLIYNNLGDALAKFGQIKEASVCYRRALELAAKQQTLIV